MCGIAGIINFDPDEPVPRELVADMNRAQRHRGPDGDGVFLERNAGLGHCRLAIIDPSAAAQPMLGRGGRVALSYNGEVYNYVELREELRKECPFSTASDTEVVLRAYEKWGMGCLEKFRGMFALAIYDLEKGKAYLARDRAGVKPLYYFHDGRRFAFASELGALRRVPGMSLSIDRTALADYFRYQYVPVPRTIYKGVRKLAPGSMLELDMRSGELREEKYWRLRINIGSGAEEEYLERLKRELEETTRMCVRSDVPFGVFLSGGVDSSLVAAMTSKVAGGGGIRTFTIGYKEEKHSEAPHAAEAASILGTLHHEETVSSAMSFDVLREVSGRFGEPFGDSSAIPTYYVSRFASEHVKMVLSGDGGDELFAGYRSYMGAFENCRTSLWRISSLLARWLPGHARRALLGIHFPELKAEHDPQRRLGDDFALSLVPDAGPLGEPEYEADPGPDCDPVTRFQAIDFSSYLPGDVLTKVDRMSMARSLEVRVPLLDHKIIELAFSIPLRHKIRMTPGGAEGKIILKKCVADVFSESFLSRPKRGFGIPINEWCRDAAIRGLMEEDFLRRDNPAFDHIERSAAESVVKKYYGGDDQLVAHLWFLLMFNLWIGGARDAF